MARRTFVRTALDLSDRAKAGALRREIRELLIARQGYDHEVSGDPKLDGRTLCAFDGGRMVATIDTHWGREGDLPDGRVSVVGATDAARRYPDQIVVLDEPILHPDVSHTPVELELKHAAVRLAARDLVRWVYATCAPTDIQTHRALGFRPSGAPAAFDHGPTRVPISLDLADVDHLRRVRSPFVRFAERMRATMPDMEVSDDELMDPHAEVRWRELHRLSHEAEEADATFLSAVRGATRAKLLEEGTLLHPPQGSPIVSEGESGRDMFLVLRGAVQVRRGDEAIALIGLGEVFGEVGFLLKARRTADVVAATDDVAVLRLSRASLQALMSSDPALAASLAIAIAQGLCYKLMDRPTE